MHVIVTVLTGPLGLVSSTDVTRTKLQSTSLSKTLSPKVQKTLTIQYYTEIQYYIKVIHRNPEATTATEPHLSACALSKAGSSERCLMLSGSPDCARVFRSQQLKPFLNFAVLMRPGHELSQQLHTNARRGPGGSPPPQPRGERPRLPGVPRPTRAENG